MTTAWSSEQDADAELRAVIAQQLEHAMGTSAWRPLPHQVAPPGDWIGWMLLAGRGSGKTEGCSNHVVEHVNGPACLPGPVPHWGAIIAPTLGDAATACYSGPAGIRRFSPEAVLSQKIGGQLITWPNGSQFKLYGAREPDDVERLRAGGNTCVVAGTLIATSVGDVPVERIRPGDLVWTRNGLRAVLRAGQTGVRKVITVRSAGYEITATPDHLIWNGTTWQRLDVVDRLTTCQTQRSSTTTVSSGADETTGTTPTADTACCTATSIKSRLVQSRLARIFTTAIIAAVTTTRRTSLRSRHKSTKTNTLMIVNGTSLVVSLRGLGNVGPDESVSGVTIATLAEQRSVSSAVATVGILEHHHERTNSGCAACAAVSSPANDGIRVRLAVQPVVRRTPTSSVAVPVYDLLVEHDHEFIANGVLVANCLVWCEELAAWRYMEDAFDQMKFGLRVGPRPHWIGSSTPKPRPLIKRFDAGDEPHVVVTRATMYDNPYLPRHIRDALEEAYGGTAIGAQELMGRLVEQDEHALWTRENIADNRLTTAPALRSVVVGVDPSGGSGEQGIVVVGAGSRPNPERPQLVEKHGYVLADETVCLKPEGWSSKAVRTAVDWDANAIVVETNFGGDMAVSTLQTAAEYEGVAIPIKTVHASRGKSPRAQPVSAMSVQGRWHLVGTFESLEDQLCTWTEDSKYSPDRLDAMVWPAWYLRLVSTMYRAVGSFGAAAMTSRVLTRRHQ